jgi:hypothetical protein
MVKNTNITKQDITNIVKSLKKCKPGLLPLEIFLEIARLTVTPIIEIVPLRNVPLGTEVLLVERDKNDPNWPGMLHTPGTVLRANDKEGAFEDAFGRILKGELGLSNFGGKPNLAGYIFHQVKRGRELGLVFWIEITTPNEPKIGRFYPYSNLPSNIIATQIPHIDLAVNHFLEKT